ncbi:hypothetical protein [Methylobacterium sp. GXF4]|uniref:hypothetical protein n=1 Tax=Methylobacterium sp. GXF4 TaxID=1096546 RepID=UPI000FFEB547|nr:hypothetical protein [Methylobacterium sp. GXF4]
MADKTKRDLDDLEWLVEQRARNQNSSLSLYKLYIEYQTELSDDVVCGRLFRALIGVNFSLWRSVFLSDVDKTAGLLERDAEIFLVNLIENNAVGYSQDRASNYWTFRYYVSAARDILRRKRKETKDLEIIPKLPKENPSGSAHDWWELHQTVLDTTIANFTRHLSAARTSASDDG